MIEMSIMSKNRLNIEQLESEIKSLQRRVEELKYTEKINQVSFEISNAVNTTDDLNELYKSIHESLKKVLPLPSFFISIIDKEKDWLSFPYHEDFHDDTGDAYLPRSLKRPSLTNSVITSGKPLFLTKKELKKRFEKGAVCGLVSAVWIGAPLIISGEVIGVIAMYSYDDPDIFTQKNMDLFVSISNQVAIAIDRKHALEKLEKNEETFRALTENFDDIIMRFDRSYRHLYVSPAVRYLKLDPDKMIGRTHEELGFASEMVKTFERKIEKVFAIKKIGRMEFYFPQGFWFDCLLCPEFSPEGDVVAVISSARDITDRKRLELQRGSLNRINQVIINAGNLDGMLSSVLEEVQTAFTCDRSWIAHFNSSTLDFKLINEYSLSAWPGVGINPNKTEIEINKRTVSKLIELSAIGGVAVFNQEEVKQLQSSKLEEYGVKSMMIFPVHGEGNEIWLFGLHQCNKEKIWTSVEQEFFKQVGQRITDGLNNMLLNQRLRDAKNYIDSIVDSMPSALIGVDIEFKITRMNSKAEKDSGAEFSRAEGNKLDSIFPYLKQHFEKITHAMEEQKVTEMLKIPRQIDGIPCFENIIIYPLVDETIKGAVIRIDEVTEQAKIEEMMIQSEKMLSIGGLAAGMAHEINNPLAGMMQNAQVVTNRLLKDLPANNEAAMETGVSMELLKNYMLKRKIPETLENINKAGQNAANIVQNMLSFARERTGLQVYNNMPELIERTIDLAKHDYNLKKKYDFRNIEVLLEYDDNLPDILCEDTMIQQVIFNILKNGTEAMYDKFNCLKKDDCVIKPQFTIKLFQKKKKLCLDIVDNGPGMTEDIAKRIFDPFFTTKGPDKGTGLGLSVSYFIIVENHQGEITVESTPGQGSTFMIKLPIT